MAFDHRFLHRVQPRAIGSQAFDGDQLLAIERRQKLDARIDGTQSYVFAVPIKLRDHNRAGAAITFGTSLLGARAAKVLPQKL